MNGQIHPWTHSNGSERLISNNNQIPECSGPNSTRRLKYSNIQYIIANWLDEFSLNNPLNNLAIRAYNYSKTEHNSVLICTTETTPILVLICIQHASLTTEHTATAKQGSNSGKGILQLLETCATRSKVISNQRVNKSVQVGHSTQWD